MVGRQPVRRSIVFFLVPDFTYGRLLRRRSSRCARPTACSASKPIAGGLPRTDGRPVRASNWVECGRRYLP